MSEANIAHDPTQVKKDLGEYYGVINRNTVKDIWAKGSPLAVAVYVLLDTHTNGHGQHVERETLLKFAPCSIRTLDRGIKELKKLGYLKVTRHLGSNYYELINPVRNSGEIAKSELSKLKTLAYQNREEVDKYVYSNSPNMSTSNRSKYRNKIQTGENRNAPSVSGVSLDVKGSKKFNPYKRLTDEKRSYIDEFNLHLERNLSERIDVNSLKTQTIDALIEAQDLGLTPLEFANECSQLVSKEMTARARGNRPLLGNPVGYLIDQLPEWVSYKLWSNKETEIPDSIPDSEHLPHTVKVLEEAPIIEEDYLEVTVNSVEDIENMRQETNLMLDSIRVKTKQPLNVAISPTELKTKRITELKKQFPKHTNNELRSIYRSRYNTVITDEELNL